MSRTAAISKNGRIVGTRLSVYDVLPFLERGRSIEYIAEVLPLSIEELQAAVEYVASNRAHVDEVHRQIEERISRGNPPDVERKVEETKERMEKWLTERRRSRTTEGEGDHAAEGAAC